jgi:signal transduction histidine kinase
VTSQKFSQAAGSSNSTEAAPQGTNTDHPNRPLFEPQVYEILRSQLVDTPYFKDQFLMLDSEVMHEDLASANLPATDAEQQILERLESRYRQLLSQHQAAKAAKESEPKSTSDRKNSAEDLFGTPFTANVYAEAGPVFEPKDSPEGGWYVYYHVVQFPGKCMMCHARDLRYQAEEIPFRVVQIKIPFKQTEVVSATTLAVMIAVAMVTIAFTLLFVQWVFRNIVLNPLHHLTAVSDEISRGNIYLRASLDTGDEFSALGDSFNRMLRHMTDGQSKLRELNMELDVRVDQLAQANLQLYEANRLKSDFLANMSHELRTPLNSILGFSEVLQGIEALTDKQRKYVSNIQTSGRALLEMINDVLDLAKMEAGKMKVTATLFRLGDLVRAQCSALQSLIDEKNMDLQLEVAPELPEIFQDQSKIQQILTNLLSNAIKFTPDGGLITVSCGLANEDYLFLTVTDTGVGIPEDDFEIIFEKFRQSSVVIQQDGLTRQYSGTGLGLSIVKELCRLLGGQVHLTSQLGTGSTFQVILPVRYEPMPTNAVTSVGNS